MRTGTALRDLEKAEPKAIIETLAFMSYNPSIGRVLQKGGVNTFAKLLNERLPQLDQSTCREDFEEFHRDFLEEFMGKVKKTAKGEPVVYGQAQKPLNVFLKVFVHWASRPNREVAERIRPLLHVPLDSILMRQVKRLFPAQYHNIVRPAYQGCAPSERLSLVDDREKYLAWQACFRAICPDRPVLLDVLWNLGRSSTRVSGRKTTGGGR
jgi:hypothetical protein